jgi:hypothetical protein
MVTGGIGMAADIPLTEKLIYIVWYRGAFGYLDISSAVRQYSK